MAISFCDPGERKLLRAIEGLLKRRLPLLRSVEAPREEQAHTSHATGRGRERNDSDRARPAFSERAPRPASSERSRPASSERADRRPRMEIGVTEKLHRRKNAWNGKSAPLEFVPRWIATVAGAASSCDWNASFARKLAPKAKRPGKRERAEQRSQLATRIVEGEAIPQAAKKVRSKSTATKVAGAAKVGYAKNGPWSSRAPKKKFRKKG